MNCIFFNSDSNENREEIVGVKKPPNVFAPVRITGTIGAAKAE